MSNVYDILNGDYRGCIPCKKKLAKAVKAASGFKSSNPQILKSSNRLLILKRAEYDKPFTRQLVADLDAAGWRVDEMDNSRGLAPVKKLIEGPDKPGAVLRWEEHGCLFVTKAWRDFVAYLYRHDTAPLSMDLGYFAHYKALMCDRYRREDAQSAILDEWASIPDDPEGMWDAASPQVTEYRDGLRDIWQQARAAGPPDGLDPGYVLVFLQFSASLARPPFKARDMKEWAARVTERLQAAGKRVVLKASPVGPFPEIDGAPCYSAKEHVDAGEGIRVRVDPLLNARLAAHCDYAVVNCSSVTNELVAWGVPVVALGRSWFNGLGVFAEPAGWDGVCRKPEIDARARARWVRWWLSRQGGMADAPRLIAERLADFRAEPYDYAALYDAVYQATPNYGANQPRVGRIADAVAKLAPRHVLDVGCGQGALWQALAKAGTPCVGLDVARPERCAIPADQFRQGTALALPAQDAEFDAVACCDTLEHMRPSDVPKALAEIRRVAGRFAVFSVGCCKAAWPSPEGWPNLHMTQMDFDGWQRAFAEAGFDILRAEYGAPTDNVIVAKGHA